MAQAIPNQSLQADLDCLRALVADLWYPSETDAPVTVVVWPRPAVEITPDEPEQSSSPPLPPELATTSGPIATYPAEQFFQPILRQPFWHSSQGEHLAQRYAALQQFVQATLTHLHTYRIGRVDVTLYLIGQHPSGCYVGVQTSVVET